MFYRDGPTTRRAPSIPVTREYAISPIRAGRGRKSERCSFAQVNNGEGRKNRVLRRYRAGFAFSSLHERRRGAPFLWQVCRVAYKPYSDFGTNIHDIKGPARLKAIQRHSRSPPNVAISDVTSLHLPFAFSRLNECYRIYLKLGACATATQRGLVLPNGAWTKASVSARRQGRSNPA